MSMFGKPERLYADARAAQQESDKADTGATLLKDKPQERIAPAPPKPPKRPEPAQETQMIQEPIVSKNGFRGVASTVLEIAGVASISVGGFLVAPWLGCMLLGVLLVVLGVATGYGA